MELKRLRGLAENYGTSSYSNSYSAPTQCVASELVGQCFAARTAMHIAHLQSTSYAEHVALGDFYDEVATLADSFIESYMGITGRMVSIPHVMSEHEAPPIAFLSALQEWLTYNRAEAAEGHTELENAIDEILSLVDRTCYKLKFLR